MSTTDELIQCPSCPRRFISRTCFSYHIETHRKETDPKDPDLSRKNSCLGQELADIGDRQGSLDSLVHQDALNLPNPQDLPRVLNVKDNLDPSDQAKKFMPGEEETIPAITDHPGGTSARMLTQVTASDRSTDAQGNQELGKPLKLTPESDSSRRSKKSHGAVKRFKCQQCEKSFNLKKT